MRSLVNIREISETRKKEKCTYEEQLAALAYDLIEDALQQSNNNQAEAAQQLGLTYHQFRHYYRKYFS